MSDDDNTSKMLRELREKAEHQRSWESIDRLMMRFVSPFYGTWLRPSTIKKRRGHHIRPNILMLLLLLALIICLVVLLLAG
jgi:ferric-dicitrate binding protein FerR (iron transport regulator)